MVDDKSLGDARVYSINEVRLLRYESDITEIKVSVQKMEHALMGNGEPSKGLIARTERLEEWRKSIDRRTWVHIVVSAINLILLLLLAVRLGVI